MQANAGLPIRTSRLLLDRLRADDAPALFAYRGSAEIARYQGWRPADVAEAAAFIAQQSTVGFQQANSWCQLAVRDAADGRLLGDIGIHFPASANDAIEFGMSLQTSAQGRGFAREALTAVIELAFGKWGYRRAIGSVDPRNAASVSMLRALGFRQEAHHIESYWFRGEWVDDMVFALLAREWPRI